MELFLDFGVLYIEKDKSAEKSEDSRRVKNLLQKKNDYPIIRRGTNPETSSGQVLDLRREVMDWL